MANATSEVLTPQSAFTNHEDRLQAIERLAHVLGEAFPHLHDALGLDRMPHQFTPDEMSGMMHDPNRTTLDGVIASQQQMQDKLDALLDRIGGQLSGPSSGPVVNQGELTSGD